MASTSSDKLIELIRSKGYAVPADAKIIRTYAGRHQKATGASVWMIVLPGGLGSLSYKVISSIFTVTELLKASDIEVSVNRYSGDIDVIVAED